MVMKDWEIWERLSWELLNLCAADTITEDQHSRWANVIDVELLNDDDGQE